jgi:hypothetical protein
MKRCLQTDTESHWRCLLPGLHHQGAGLRSWLHVEIFETDDGFSIRFVDEKFKQSRHSDEELRSSDTEDRLLNMDQKIQQMSLILAKVESIIPFLPIPQATETNPDESTRLIQPGSKLVGQLTRARGLVGYDVALTRRRSGVRISSSP